MKNLVIQCRYVFLMDTKTQISLNVELTEAFLTGGITSLHVFVSQLVFRAGKHCWFTLSPNVESTNKVIYDVFSQPHRCVIW